VIEVDGEEFAQVGKVSPFKRELDYHYRTVYGNMREPI
jgi:hypothetical protein